jgi:hypothetical protein
MSKNEIVSREGEPSEPIAFNSPTTAFTGIFPFYLVGMEGIEPSQPNGTDFTDQPNSPSLAHSLLSEVL